MGENVLPQVLLPLVKVVLSSESLGVGDSHIMQALTTKLLKALIKLHTHLIELLIRGIAETKHGVSHAAERLFSLLFEQGLKVFVKFASVVARIAFVVRGDDIDHERLLTKLILLKVVET